MLLEGVLKKIFGTKHERDIKRMQPLVDEINQLYDQYDRLSDFDLRKKSIELKRRMRAGEAHEDMIPQAFSAVRETSKRTIGMRHYDVQLIGGIVLFQGKIAEMKTGEGKTLVATLPCYLEGLTNRGVHLVTVNDYLARRDRDWMGPIYEFLGLRVGAIQNQDSDEQRKIAYNCNITFGTNNEFGFDYLRDNMKFSLSDYVQQTGHNYAIIDEVDSILIDEARTPLIISGPAEESTDKYVVADRIIPKLKENIDYKKEEKHNSVFLTEEGVVKTEKLMGIDNLYHPSNIEWLHHVEQALKAHSMFKRDVHYVVKNREVIIVDEFTGRLMPGRRYSDGLHQALEAKEKIPIQNENQTLATITLQNYFRMYDKLAGMTGTADTEAAEFKEIYKLDVVVIPTNRPLIRNNYPDVIYKTKDEKYRAVIKEIMDMNSKGRPCLVGTISIETSELLSSMLKKKRIPHEVLNAKHHEREAKIVAKAGQEGAVTIATNMAGRGTDIILGPGVAKKGGLHIIGTERHEARRIDNQLRGRAGRQGDPGSSRFFLSLEDDLVRIFASDTIQGIMNKIWAQEDMPLEHSLLTRSIEKAQGKVEMQNFEIRKNLLKFDDVMNKQREVVYERRKTILDAQDLKEELMRNIDEYLEIVIDKYTDAKYPEDWDWEGLDIEMFSRFGVHFKPSEDEIVNYTRDVLAEDIRDMIIRLYEERKTKIGEKEFNKIIRFFLLRTLDIQWKDHLLAMDHLKEGIGLRGYGQIDPLLAYKKEGFELFMDMNDRFVSDSLRQIFTIKVDEDIVLTDRPATQEFIYSAPSLEDAPKHKQAKSKKIGRNEPCPCGSGKKYKHCCGRT